MYKLFMASLARYRDLRTDQSHSCLSQKVHHILCEAGLNQDQGEKRILDDRQLLDWEAISKLLPDHTSDSYEYFVESAKRLAVAFKASYDHLISLTPEEFHQHFAHWLQWTSIPKVLQHCFELVKNGGDTRPAESLLLSCTVLERSLGDVYLLEGKQCPSMLKDLLLTPQLRRMFGDTVIQVLRVIIGPPISMNLRNVLWHGFPSPGEISPRYAMFVLHVLASLGQRLEDQGVHPSRIKHRAPVAFPRLHVLCFSSSGLEPEVRHSVVALFKHSSLVLPQMLPFWIRALDLYFKARFEECIALLLPQLEHGLSRAFAAANSCPERALTFTHAVTHTVIDAVTHAVTWFDECVALLLPQLEHGLRRAFAAANSCPERVLTAENDVLFTTFDEILHHQMEDGSPNRLRHYLGTGHVSMLMDLLMYPEGPRLRDRLSHGECALLFAGEEQPGASEEQEEQWRLMANHVIAVVVSLCLLFLPNDELVKSEPYLQRICGVAGKYTSTFHPLALLQTELRDTAHALAEWITIQRPSAEELDITSANDVQSSDPHCVAGSSLLIAGKAVMRRCCGAMHESEMVTFLQPFAPAAPSLSRHVLQFNTLYRYREDPQETSRNSMDSSLNSADTSLNSADTSLNSADTSLNSMDSSLKSTDTRLNSTDTRLNSADTSLNSMDSSLKSADTRLNSTDNRLNSTDTRLNSADTSLNSMDSSLKSTDTRLNSTDTSLNSADTSLNSMDSSLKSADTRLNSTDTRLNSTDTRLNSTDTSLNSTDTKLNSTDTSLNSSTTRLDTAQKTPNKEEQIVGLLRRILAEGRAVCGQVAELCAVRHQQWRERTLRSRQRSTYLRMLNTLPELSSGLKLVLLVALSFLYQMQESSLWVPAQQQADIKFLKAVLQYSENLASYTHPEKNRWDEARKLTQQLYRKCSQR